MRPLSSPPSLQADPRKCLLISAPRNTATQLPTTTRERANVAVASTSSSTPQPSSSSPARLPGAPGARTAQAAEERQQLFNEIAPVYDVVSFERRDDTSRFGTCIRLSVRRPHPVSSSFSARLHNQQLNDALSLGLHRVWKRMAVRWSGARRGDRVLDLCCGSGDVARLLASRVGPAGGVVGLDFAREMLLDAEKRSNWRRKKESAREDADDYEEEQEESNEQRRLYSPTTSSSAEIEWVLGDATSLTSFADGSFDAATLAYGLRNVSDPLLALKEARRVLKPGGKIAVLDFNHSESGLVDSIQAAALSAAVVPVARALGVGPQYEYLRPSILAYPTGKELVELAREAGFHGEVRFHEIALGLMGTLVAGTKRRRS